MPIIKGPWRRIKGTAGNGGDVAAAATANGPVGVYPTSLCVYGWLDDGCFEGFGGNNPIKGAYTAMDVSHRWSKSQVQSGVAGGTHLDLVCLDK